MSEKQALEIVARGRDVAAASNKNSNQAIKAMMQAVVKLRPELLSEYGIEMNLVKVYKEAADQLGIKTSELTYSQKIQAMYNAIIGEATRMEGSYSEAMNSWYKISNSVKDGIISLKLILGDMLDNAMKPSIDYVYQTIKSFRAWAFTEENEINPQLKATADIIGQVLMTAFEGLKKSISFVIEVSGKFVDVVKAGIDIINRYQGLLTIFRTSWDNIALVFKENLLPELQKLWEALQPLQPFLEVFAQTIGVILLGALIAVVKIIEVSLIVLIQTLTSIIEAANAGIEKFKDIWDATTTTISKVIGWIDKLINSIKRLNVVQSAKSAISGALGFGGGKARGGFVSPTKAYLVGEEGPELFVPGISGNIIPNNKLGGGRTIINVNITGNTIMDRKGAERIGDLMIRKLKTSNLLG
jgi:phage-related protein